MEGKGVGRWRYKRDRMETGLGKGNRERRGVKERIVKMRRVKRRLMTQVKIHVQ